MWNYRIVKTRIGDEDYYGIYEVYYDADDNLEMRTEDRIGPSGSSMDEVRADMRMMMQAFLKPILTDDDFPQV